MINSPLIDKNTPTAYFEELLKTFNSVFPPSFKNTAEGRLIKDDLLGRINTKLGRSAPNFEVNDIVGKKLRLADFKGKKYVLVDFWATWCVPCMNQIPFIKQIRQTYPEDLLAIISVSADTDNKYFKQVIKEKEMNWLHVYGNTEMPLKFGVTAYPSLFLIDKDGVVIFDGKGKGKEDLIALLKAMK
jgi:thiol-disulfide isomerase/thioredoxin